MTIQQKFIPAFAGADEFDTPTFFKFEGNQC